MTDFLTNLVRRSGGLAPELARPAARALPPGGSDGAVDVLEEPSLVPPARGPRPATPTPVASSAAEAPEPMEAPTQTPLASSAAAEVREATEAPAPPRRFATKAPPHEKPAKRALFRMLAERAKGAPKDSPAPRAPAPAAPARGLARSVDTPPPPHREAAVRGSAPPSAPLRDAPPPLVAADPEAPPEHEARPAIRPTPRRAARVATPFSQAAPRSDEPAVPGPVEPDTSRTPVRPEKAVEDDAPPTNVIAPRAALQTPVTNGQPRAPGAASADETDRLATELAPTTTADARPVNGAPPSVDIALPPAARLTAPAVQPLVRSAPRPAAVDAAASASEESATVHIGRVEVQMPPPPRVPARADSPGFDPFGAARVYRERIWY